MVVTVLMYLHVLSCPHVPAMCCCAVIVLCAAHTDLGGTSNAVVALQPGSSLTFNALTLVNAMPSDDGVSKDASSYELIRGGTYEVLHVHACT
jgi:hypothetical protein